MRFAFVTTEFPVSRPKAGGLASYGARMTALLAAAGHEVEIFIPVDHDLGALPAEMPWQGCRLHHVLHRRPPLARLATRAMSLAGLDHRTKALYWASRAQAVADAVAAVEAKRPFDVVHSADSYGIGLAIPARPGRLNLVRCSAAMDLYMACDGRVGPADRIHAAREAEAVAKADLAIAPSRLIADHYTQKLGRPVLVIRTPITVEETAPAPPPPGLPPRYLLHFANDLLPRKGTDLVAAALPEALSQAPDLTMLWVGRIDPALRARLLDPLGPDAAARVICLPRQDRPVLQALIRGATAAVLPSRVDNLPNTVLESLTLGTPVIGSRDSSIEEMVEDGVTGVLVPNGSAPDLAEAMVRAWQGRLELQPGVPWPDSATGRAFRPEVALEAYLDIIQAALTS